LTAPRKGANCLDCHITWQQPPLEPLSTMQSQHFSTQQQRHLHQAGGGGVEAGRAALQHRNRQLRLREAAGAQRLLRPRQRITHLRWPLLGVERAKHTHWRGDMALTSCALHGCPLSTTSPNVLFMCEYQGTRSAEQLPQRGAGIWRQTAVVCHWTASQPTGCKTAGSTAEG
jgi:hypothetical protein